VPGLFDAAGDVRHAAPDMPTLLNHEIASPFRIGDGKAFVDGGWSEELAAALRVAQPSSMELQAHVHDLRRFSGAVDSVVHLKLAGRAEDAKIDSIAGLEVFARLQSLEIRSPVKRGLLPVALPHLKQCALHWQPGCEVFTANPSVESLALMAYAASSLAELRVSDGLRKLWLSKPAVLDLTGLRAASSLEQLRVTDARSLARLEGVEALRLTSIDIETAPRLLDVSALGRLGSLRTLRLVGTAASVDLAPLASIKTLQWLHAGGPRMPPLDWPGLLALPGLSFVSGTWDPGVVDEARLRALVPAARQITRFDPVKKRGVTPLLIELADAGAPPS
jgi:hypothetical protein